jgi:hypothetical protein
MAQVTTAAGATASPTAGAGRIPGAAPDAVAVDAAAVWAGLATSVNTQPQVDEQAAPGGPGRRGLQPSWRSPAGDSQQQSQGTVPHGRPWHCQAAPAWRADAAIRIASRAAGQTVRRRLTGSIMAENRSAWQSCLSAARSAQLRRRDSGPQAWEWRRKVARAGKEHGPFHRLTSVAPRPDRLPSRRASSTLSHPGSWPGQPIDQSALRHAAAPGRGCCGPLLSASHAGQGGSSLP